MDLLPAVRDLRASSVASVNNEPLIKFVVKKIATHTHTSRIYGSSRIGSKSYQIKSYY